jgi:hypothetical protein
MKKKTKWKRNCPKCEKEISYTQKSSKNRAERRNTNCGSCVWGSDEVRKNISESLKGKKRKSFTDEWKRNISESKKGIPRSEETKKNIAKVRKGKTYEEIYGKEKAKEMRKKQRLTLKKRIENRCGQISPNYNEIGCKIIRWFNMYYDFNFQHAENGGEVCIDGYWPDGLDEGRKTIIEIDEKHHFNPDGTYKQKDIRRQKYLENLGYTFIRIKI